MIRHVARAERYAERVSSATSRATGIRQFTVGTGGTTVEVFGTPRPNSEVRATNVYGVLKLTLADGSYSWELIPIAAQTFTDAGTTSCH